MTEKKGSFVWVGTGGFIPEAGRVVHFGSRLSLTPAEARRYGSRVQKESAFNKRQDEQTTVNSAGPVHSC